MNQLYTMRHLLEREAIATIAWPEGERLASLRVLASEIEENAAAGRPDLAMQVLVEYEYASRDGARRAEPPTFGDLGGVPGGAGGVPFISGTAASTAVSVARPASTTSAPASSAAAMGSWPIRATMCSQDCRTWGSSS
jgi:hypothetical protein